MKKLIVILMILVVGIFACGCTSQPAAPATTTVQTTATPTAVPTVVNTTVPTTVPTVVNTTAVPTANVTANITTATPTPTPLPDVKVEILNSWAFKPSTITVPAGTKVIWTKKSVDDYIYQIIIKGTVGSVATSPVISTANPTWSYTFSKAGTYTIDDTNHPSFQDGKVIVT